jgi:hypothetical protein
LVFPAVAGLLHRTATSLLVVLLSQKFAAGQDTPPHKHLSSFTLLPVSFAHSTVASKTNRLQMSSLVEPASALQYEPASHRIASLQTQAFRFSSLPSVFTQASVWATNGGGKSDT